MFQAVCVTKNRSLGQKETKEEAMQLAKKHRERSGHIVRVFDVVEDQKKATGAELINDEVESAKELKVPSTDD